MTLYKIAVIGSKHNEKKNTFILNIILNFSLAQFQLVKRTTYLNLQMYIYSFFKNVSSSITRQKIRLYLIPKLRKFLYSGNLAFSF